MALAQGKQNIHLNRRYPLTDGHGCVFMATMAVFTLVVMTAVIAAAVFIMLMHLNIPSLFACFYYTLNHARRKSILAAEIYLYDILGGLYAK